MVFFWTFDSQNTATDRPCKIWFEQISHSRSIAYSLPFNFIIHLFWETECDFENFIVVIKWEILLWKIITAYFVAKSFVVFAWAPSTRLSSSLTSRHAKRCCSSFLCFLSTGQRERDGQSPNQNLEKFSSFELRNICTWEFRLMALKWFQIVPGEHKAWRGNRVCILSSKHAYRPMRMCVLS